MKRIFGRLGLAAVLIAGLLYQSGDTQAASLTNFRALVQITGSYVSTVGLSDVAAPLASTNIQDLTNGVGANQGNVLYTARRVVTTGATDTLDLNGGGLTDAFGAALAPARLRLVFIRSATGNTTNLTFLGNANAVPILNTAATTTTLKPGAMCLFTAPDAAGFVVTPGTGDIIQVVNAAGASATYDIIIVGTSS